MSLATVEHQAEVSEVDVETVEGTAEVEIEVDGRLAAKTSSVDCATLRTERAGEWALTKKDSEQQVLKGR